jgi:hypothetical protein
MRFLEPISGGGRGGRVAPMHDFILAQNQGCQGPLFIELFAELFFLLFLANILRQTPAHILNAISSGNHAWNVVSSWPLLFSVCVVW